MINVFIIKNTIPKLDALSQRQVCLLHSEAPSDTYELKKTVLFGEGCCLLHLPLSPNLAQNSSRNIVIHKKTCLPYQI